MNYRRTLNYRLFMVTVIIAVPVILLLLIVNGYNVDKLKHRKLEESQLEVEAEISRLDTMLELLDIAMANLTISNPDLRLVAQAEEENLDFWRACQRNMLKLQNLSDASTLKYTIFAYFPKQNIVMNRMRNEGLTSHLLELMNDNSNTMVERKWMPIVINDIAYAVRIIEYDNFYLGAWISYNDLYDKIGVSSDMEKKYLFMDNYGELLNNLPKTVLDPTEDTYKDLNGHNWYVITAKSKQAEVSLVKMISEDGMAAELPKVTESILIVAGVLILAMTTFIIGLYRWVVSPMNHIKDSISVISSGDMTYRIPEIKDASDEIHSTIIQFNSMMNRLEELKIVIYEGRLERQEIELNYLEQQIQPHFILNTLNTLYNYCERDQKATKEIILLLSKFYRYVVNVNSRYVSLGQELEHIRNYLQLQKVRFPTAFDYDINCMESLQIVPVPPFIIESFVINAMKYGLTNKEPSRICVDVKLIDEFHVIIRISDTGEGFSIDVLDSINDYINKGQVTEELGVGIKNAIERMRLIYKNKATIVFYNQKPQGAVVEIQIELQDKKEA